MYDNERVILLCRKYDADLKKAFEQLRRVVPRLPRSYSRVSGYLTLQIS